MSCISQAPLQLARSWDEVGVIRVISERPFPSSWGVAEAVSRLRFWKQSVYSQMAEQQESGSLGSAVGRTPDRAAHPPAQTLRERVANSGLPQATATLVSGDTAGSVS